MKTRLYILILLVLSAATSFGQDTTARYRSTLSAYEREIVQVPRIGGGLLNYIISRQGKSPLFVDTSQVYNWAEKFVAERQRAQVLLSQSVASERSTSDTRYRRVTDAIALNQITGALDSIGKKANYADVLKLQQGGARDSSAYTKTQTNFLLGGKADAPTTTTELARRATAATIVQIRAWSATLPTTFFVTDAGKAGNFVRDDTDTGSPDDGVRVLVTAGGVRYKRVGRDGLFVGAEYGLKGDATTDEVNSFTAACAAVNARTGKGMLTLDGKIYKFTKPLKIDFSRLKVPANGAVLDFSALTSGTAIAVTGRGNGAAPYGQSNTGLDGLEIVGPGKTSAVKAFVFDTPVEGGTAHMNLNQVIIHGFGTGIEYGNNAYIENLAQSSIYDCGTGVRVLNGVNNGERIDLTQTSVFNCGLGLDQQNPNSTVFVHGGSFDYNTQHVKITAGRVVFQSVHTEGKDYAGYPFEVSGNGGALVYDGGEIVTTPSTVFPPAYFHVMTNPRVGGGVWLSHVSINNCQTTTGLLADGTGDYYPTGTDGYENTSSAILTSRNANRALDGSFETASVPDDIVVVGDQPNTDRLNARNAVVQSLTYASALSGTRSLQYYKVFGGSSGNPTTSRVYIAYPITPGLATAFRGYMKKEGSSVGGTLYFTYYFASGKYQNANGYTAFRKVVGYNPAFPSQEAIDITSNMPDWIRIGTGQPLSRAPMDATHFLIEIVGDSWNSAGDSIRFDDFIVTQQ